MSDNKKLKQPYFKAQGLHHGGRILAAAAKYQINENDWIDLSTGLNPNAWPVPNIPAAVWQALPEDDDALQEAACNYYGCDACLPVAGSQAAIQTLPTLRSLSRVGVISPTYAEHEYNWQQAGHDVIQLCVAEVEQHIHALDVLVVINPNNPTGEIVAVKKLLDWHQQLASRGGWLIVDEAFMDASPKNSLVSSAIKPGLIVLRSMGKFFGLAGIRCGFVISDNDLLQRLSAKLGPWSLTGATRYIAKKALLDTPWQKETRAKLHYSSVRLHDVLRKHGLVAKGATDFFQWVEHENAKQLYKACAEKGILIRLFEQKEKMLMPSLRFGLPVNETQWQKLNVVLSEISEIIFYQQKEKALCLDT